MSQDVLIAFIAGILGAGGILGSKGIIDRYLTTRQDMSSSREVAEQGQDTTVINTVMTLTKELSAAMVELARDALNNNQMALANIAASLDSHSRESQGRYDRTEAVWTDAKGLLEKNVKALASIEEKLDALLVVVENR